MKLYSSEHLELLWGSNKVGRLFTPVETVCNMLDMLDDIGFWDKPSSLDGYAESHRFIDIYCKSGRFLQYAYIKFSLALDEIIPCNQERDRYIWGRLVYALCDNEFVTYALRQKFNCNNIYQFSWDLLERGFDGMKFDVVVGNPPYNNDMYLEFVEKGFKLSSQYTCMITPAKFHSLRNDVRFQEFMKNIFKHMKKCVYYPCEDDIFTIVMTCGIFYFLLDKNNYSVTDVKNVSSISYLNSDYVGVSKKLSTLNISSINIVSKIVNAGFDVESLNKIGLYKVTNRGILMTTSYGGVFSGTIGEVRSSSLIIPKSEINKEISHKTHSIIFSSDSKEEAESFLSFLNTKLVRYLLWVGNCGYSNAFCNPVWRFVPSISKFDHIFTDDELYLKYGLADNEIDMIESIIRERK